ncbi:predicted protein [Fibroporia radiculosa]|uniref:Uncharacterized protein n=1 Tax=Fibroporia radiculosa TaxID=599839 RepID=J7SCW9_9APHY|nr:predicted protein [Fibroporia radiculosa]
MHPEPEEYLHR